MYDRSTFNTRQENTLAANKFCEIPSYKIHEFGQQRFSS